MHERKYKIKDGKIVKRLEEHKAIPDDEPIFIFRAKDRKALPALVAYHMVLDTLEQKESVKKSINDFRAFMENNPEIMNEPSP